MAEPPAVPPAQPPADPLAQAIAAASRREAGDAPVFAAPWQAKAFATVVALHQAGSLDWPDWAARLSAAIRAAQEAGDPDLGDTYYDHWAVALEGLLADSGLVARQEHEADTAALLRHRAVHRHGLPSLPGHAGHSHAGQGHAGHRPAGHGPGADGHDGQDHD